MPIVIFRFELGVTKIASIICGSYIERIIHPLLKKKKKEEEEEEEGIIYPVMDLWSKLKFIYLACTHTKIVLARRKIKYGTLV